MNNETKKEKKNTGKKIAVGVAAVVAVAAVAVPTGLMFAGGSKEASANTENNKYTIVVSSSLEGQADYTLSVEKGTKISTLRTMLKAIDGYDIAGIYKDASLTTEYKDDEYISEDTKIFIKFEALTYTVKVYDENKQNPTTEEVNHGEALNLTAPENKETNLGTYKFLGYYTVVGDNKVDLNNITSDLEIYPKFEIEYKEYSFGYSFGDGNDYSSSIKVSVGGEEKTLNDTYHYGSIVKIRVVAKEGYEPSNFQVQTAGEGRIDCLSYAYMVVENGKLCYEVELEGNGNIDIYYSEVEAKAYSLGTLPDGVIVKRNDKILTSEDKVYFGDELEITYDADRLNVGSFEVTGAKHAYGNTYFVTCDMAIIYQVDEYYYLTFSECEGGYEVTGFDKTSDVKNVVIPSTYKGKKVVGIASASNYEGGVFYNSSITSVIIQEGVTNIGAQAFRSCTNLSSIIIPSSITSIGSEAFAACRRLTSMNYLGTVNSWAQINFENSLSNPIARTKKLTIQGQDVTEINISGITSINYCAFYYCQNITSVVIGEGVISIGANAFFDCTKLASVTISNSVTSIGDNAFRGCTNLSSIMIPSSIINIGQSAFWSCTKLTSIIIPSSVLSIGNAAFSSCNNLNLVTIESSAIYKVACGTNNSNAGYLLTKATEVRVLKTIVDDESNTNTFLNDETKYTKTLSDDGLYYVYTKVAA